ncbi:MAG: hypothetical protein M3R08_11510 [Bacteroidota bacterium]|nr:hypothetical protein [Bacteroidota bacterium]
MVDLAVKACESLQKPLSPAFHCKSPAIKCAGPVGFPLQSVTRNAGYGDTTRSLGVPEILLIKNCFIIIGQKGSTEHLHFFDSMENTIIPVILGVILGGAIILLNGPWIYFLIVGIITERQIKRQKARRTMEKLAARSAPTILVLRSFARESMAYMQSKPSPEVMPVHDGVMTWTPVNPMNLIDALLPSTISPFLCLWFSNKNERSESIVHVRVEDSEWEKRFLKLARLCNVILIIPGRTDGLLVELSFIVANDLIGKIVFVMPSENMFRITGTVRTNSFAKAWQELQMTIADAGFRLPDYTARGMVFSFANDRSIAKSSYLYEEGHVSSKEDYDAAGIDRGLPVKFNSRLLNVVPLFIPLQPDPRIYEVLDAWRT